MGPSVTGSFSSTFTGSLQRTAFMVAECLLIYNIVHRQSFHLLLFPLTVSNQVVSGITISSKASSEQRPLSSTFSSPWRSPSFPISRPLPP
ncbi:hypothetical protein EJ08DRAFT_156985 [Tothia fuscella]|uniref:Uncharacterized protein n=1 Tax=Tothia fuscella TaxID=1048955 RepID=A0A9P4U477_9PEZI|nr:hypothetical protein EJ08DRAFT_156985 [Tothia fuscella]